MECGDVEPLLSAWVDGQLSEAEGQRVRDHLARCPSCWGELQVLEQVGSRLTTLKGMESPQPPEGLLAGVRALPTWLVRLGVIRRWLALGGGVTVAWAAAWLLLAWSDPLTATLTARGMSASQTLTTGRMLVARDQETLDLALPRGAGTIRLEGPGVLVIRRAVVGHLRQDQRLAMELPSGRAAIRFGPEAPTHEIHLTTPHAAITLTGTWVLISAESSRTQVDTLEGSATVKQLGAGRQVELAAGERAQVGPDTLTLAPIPVEEWLARKGLAMSSDQAPNSAPSTANSSVGHSPLWHEAE